MVVVLLEVDWIVEFESFKDTDVEFHVEVFYYKLFDKELSFSQNICYWYRHIGIKHASKHFKVLRMMGFDI